MASRPDLEFIYLGDPMCSWCWGFAPTLEALGRDFDIPIGVRVGGLAVAANARGLTPGMLEYVRHHWDQVEATTGQPFDHDSLLARSKDWVYDTELSCRAVAAMRELEPDRALAFFSRVQRAFYAQGVDVTDPEVYLELAAPYASDLDAFLELFGSEDSRRLAWTDFAWSREKGISAFPSLLMRDGGEMVLVCEGYSSAERLTPMLRAYFEKQHGLDVAGQVCRLDGEGC